MPKYMTMAPTLVREPFRREGWVFEEKVEGWRIVAYKDSDRVRLVSHRVFPGPSELALEAHGTQS
jgi:ATP-dependent DNA ligase